MDTATIKHVLLIVLTCVCAIATVVVAHPGVRSRIARFNHPLQIVSYIISRPVLYYLLFFLTGPAKRCADLSMIYHPQAQAVLGGGVPGRDFYTAYSPLYSYLMAAVYWPFPKDFYSAAVLLFIAVDLACLFMLRGLAKDLLPKGSHETATWLFILCPLTWMISIHYGQDENLVAFFILAAIYAAERQKNSLASAILGLGVAMTKITSVIAVVVFCLRKKGWPRFGELTAAAVPSVLTGAVFALLGSNLLEFRQTESCAIGGRSLTAIMFAIFSPQASRAPMSGIFPNVLKVAPQPQTLALLSGMMLAVLLAGIFIARRRQLPLYHLFAVVFLLFFVFSFKSLCIYRAWIVCPMILVALKTKRIALFSAWALFAAVIPFRAESPVSSWLYICADSITVILEIAWIAVLLFGKTPEAVEMTAGKPAEITSEPVELLA